MLFLQDWWLLWQKQLANAGASNYIPQILLGVITCPRSRCPFLKHNSSNINHSNGNRMENIAVIWEFCTHHRKSCLAITMHHCDDTVAFQILTHKSPWAGKSCKFKLTISSCFYHTHISHTCRRRPYIHLPSQYGNWRYEGSAVSHRNIWSCSIRHDE